MKNMLIGALALSLIAGSASATDFAVRGSYQDTGAYTASVIVTGPQVGSFNSDLTLRAEGENQFSEVTDLEVGATYGDRFKVRGALGFAFANGDADTYYNVTPSYTLNVPYTDSFLVRVQYENAFDADNFEVYGYGVEAGWNVGPVGVSLGIDSFFGDHEYNEFTVGVSRKF